MHELRPKQPKPLAAEVSMYREEFKIQQKIEDFFLPFGGHLDGSNRWVILSKKIPWEKIESDYSKQFSSSGLGAPAKSFRMALGSLIIKEKIQLSDDETVEHIKETPYLQYFIVMEGYKDESPFDSSMMVHFRKRLDGKILQKANEVLFREYQEKDLKKNGRYEKN